MSVRKLAYIACDGCGDPCGGDEAMRDTAAEARRNAQRRYGWTRVWTRAGGMDLCPKCAKDVAKS